tara:strand:+ start:2533 stop:6327 length:3795 start_codon:yes stop_codon:yes gene_type:complete
VANYNEEQKTSVVESKRKRKPNANRQLRDIEGMVDYNVDIASLFAMDSLPNVAISKITLSEGLSEDALREMYDKDPHIEEASAKAPIKDRYGKEKFPTPRKEVDRKNVEQSVLSIDVKLTMKEIIDASGYGAWYDNPDFLKYLKIRVVMSTSRSLTDQIVRGGMFLDPLYISKSRYKKYAKQKELSVEGEISKDMSKYLYFKTQDGKHKIYDIPVHVNFLTQEAKPKHVSVFAVTYIDSDQLAADFGCAAGNFLATGAKTKYGMIVGENIIDKGRTNKVSIAFTTPEGKVWMGPTSYRQNSKTYATSRSRSAKKLKHQQLPNAKIVDLRDALTPEKAQAEFTIIENEVLNLNFAYLQPTVMDPTRIKEYFTDLFPTKDRYGNFRATFGFNYQKFLKENTEFGKFFDNKNLPILQNLFELCEITQIRILRERVKDLQTINSLNVGLEGRVLFSHQHPHFIKQVVSYSGDRKGGELSPARIIVDGTEKSVSAGEPQSEIVGELGVRGSIQQISVFPETSNKIRHFSFADKDISKATDGLYRYGVEIAISDGTRKYVDKIKQDLLVAKQQLEVYYNEATARKENQQNYNDFNRGYTKEFIRSKYEQYPLPIDGAIASNTFVTAMPWSENAAAPVALHEHKIIMDSQGNGRTSTKDGHYHVITGFEIGNAVVDGKPVPNSHTHLTKTVGTVYESPWVRPVLAYLDSLVTILAGTQKINVQKISKVLYYMLSPETGNPHNILRVIKLVDNLYTQLQKIGSPPKRLDTWGIRKVGIDSARNLRVHKFFDYIYDTNFEKLTGFDYLNNIDYIDAGLKMISGKDFINRAEAETGRFFSSTSAKDLNIKGKSRTYVTNDTLVNTELSFLSPASAAIAGSQISLLKDASSVENSDLLRQAESKVLEHNFAPAFKRSNEGSSRNISVSDTSNSLSKVFDNLNIKAETLLSRAGNNLLYSGVLKMDCLTPARKYLGDSSKAIKEGLLVESLVDDEQLFTESVLENIMMATNEVMLTVLEPVKNSIEDPFSSYNNPFRSAASSMIDHAENFNLESPFNFLTAKGVSNAEFKTLPNQIKALFTNGSVKTNLLAPTTSTLSKQSRRSSMRFGYDFIKAVEVFAGYKASKTDANLIKEAIWEPLSYDIYNKSSGKILLCRLRSYENTKVNIRYKHASALPTYDEHFFLRPGAPVNVKFTVANSERLVSYSNKISKNEKTVRETVLQSLELAQTKDTNILGSNMPITQPSQRVRSGNFKSKQKATGAAESRSAAAPTMGDY